MAFDKKEYNVEYKKNNIKRIPLDVSKEKYLEIKHHADSLNESVNGFIKRSIDEQIKRDKT